MNYLDKLPEELYRMIYAYVHAEVLNDVIGKIPLVTGIWPPPNLVFAMQNSSDHVRSNALNNTYRRNMRHYTEQDWFKLLIDMERPSAYKLMSYGFNSWMSRRYKVFDMDVRGIWWNNTNCPLRLTYAGWCRLIAEPEDSHENTVFSDS